MIVKTRQTVVGILTCILLIGVLIPVSGISSESSVGSHANGDGPRINFLVGPEIIGWGITIWNYGTQPAFFIRWKIETQGVNGTTVIGGNRHGVILYLRSIRSQYMLPLTLPQIKIIQPVGHGEIKITVDISCRNAGYSMTQTTRWMLNGGKVTAIRLMF